MKLGQVSYNLPYTAPNIFPRLTYSNIFSMVTSFVFIIKDYESAICVKSFRQEAVMMQFL